MLSRWVKTVYLQPFAVLSGASQEVTFPASVANYVKESNSSEPLEPIVQLSPIFKNVFSNVPVVWESELVQEYYELGDALRQMTELDEGDEWKIEKPVFETACFIAARLFQTEHSAPRIFNHGPKSVVFNWERKNVNLYLTISADNISALISSPERVQRRLDFPISDTSSPVLLLSAIQSANLEPPRPLRLRGTVPEPVEVLG